MKMFIRRGTPSMYVTLGYILGIATVLIVNRSFDYPLVCGRAWSSTSDNGRSSADESEYVTAEWDVTPEADQRKGGINQSIVNASLIPTKDKAARYQSVKQGIVYSLYRMLRLWYFRVVGFDFRFRVSVTSGVCWSWF